MPNNQEIPALVRNAGFRLGYATLTVPGAGEYICWQQTFAAGPDGVAVSG
jgi:hypothetical protein